MFKDFSFYYNIEKHVTNLRLLSRGFGFMGIATQRAVTHIVTHSILHGASSAQPRDDMEPIVAIGENCLKLEVQLPGVPAVSCDHPSL